MTLPQNYTSIVTVTFLCLFLLMGCGYQMVGKETHIPPGLNSVAIPTFKNQTFEPGIEIPFTQAFLTEFIQDKRVNVVGRTEASSVLEGVVKYFRIYSVSYNASGFATEYQTDVVLDITLKDRAGKVLWQEKDFLEHAWFRASSSGLINEASKQTAIQEAGRLIAGRIRNRFFYNF